MILKVFLKIITLISHSLKIKRSIMKITIGEKAEAVLQSFSNISNAQRISSKLLYARNKDSGFLGVYEPPSDEVEVPEEFSVRSVSQFLSTKNMIKDPEINMEGLVITFKGNGRKISYNTTPLELVEEFTSDGHDLYRESHVKLASFILDEITLSDLRSTCKNLDLDDVYIVTDSDGNVKVHAESTITNDSIDFDVEGKGVPDCSFKFGDPKVINFFFDGVYQVQIREIEPNGLEMHVIKFVNKSIGSKEESGQLFYLYVLE